MFEKASRLKVRFNSTRGIISPEDLWDLKDAKGLAELNRMYIDLNKGLKESSEEGLLKTRATKADKELELKIAILKRVVEVLLSEKEDAVNKADNKAERDRLLAIKAQRAENAELELSDEELEKKIAAVS